MNPYELVKIEGYWWPANVGDQYTYSLKRIKSLMHAIEWCNKHERCQVVVQAGGSIGVWPKILSGYFRWVYTFEPEPVSFHCLCRNVIAENVFKVQAALGSSNFGVGIERIKLTSHRVNGEGPIPQWRIDDLHLLKCDAILLDVEGCERVALTGAIRTIIQCHPLVLVEARSKFGNQDWIPEFLDAHWYTKLASIEMDDIYVRKTDK